MQPLGECSDFGAESVDHPVLTMTQFQFDAIKVSGEAVKGHRRARSAEQLRQQLGAEGLIVLEVKRADNRAIPTVSATRHSTEVIKFTRQLAAMLRAGVRLDAAMQVLLRQSGSRHWQQVLKSIAGDLQEGRTLADALALHPRAFSAVYTNLVRSGETAGDLPKVLTRLARSLDSTDRIKRKLRAALAYPAVILAIALLVLVVLLVYIVPVFKEMFMNFQSELPPLTKAVVALSDGMTQHPATIVIVLLILLGAAMLMLRSPWASRALSNLPMKLPGLRSVVIKSEIVNFARTMATLLDGGVALNEALPLAATTVRSAKLRFDIAAASQVIADGGRLHGAWQDSRDIPPMLIEMTAVGEETGELGRMFDAVADYYSEEVETVIPSITAVIEPLLIVAVGIIVAAILISMYLPLFELIGQLG